MNRAASSPLISVEELRANPAAYVVVDCRFALDDPEAGELSYKAGHVPGAHYCHLERDLSGPLAATGGRHPLPAPQLFSNAMAELGIGANTAVVAYDSSRMAFASRLWWMLTALGFGQVQVLDGGWQQWLAQGGEVSVDAPHPTPVDAAPATGFSGLVNHADLAAAQAGGALLVDAREAVRYRGESEPIDPVAGHIPGAVNYPWQQATAEDGCALDNEAQRERWQDIPEEAELVMYCGSGVTACVNALSLQLAGRPAPRLYAGSWSDWCSRLPVN